METNKNKFDEQKAPQKNTDKAFVKVGEDGKPQMPEQENTFIKSTQKPPVDGEPQDK